VIKFGEQIVFFASKDLPILSFFPFTPDPLHLCSVAPWQAWSRWVEHFHKLEENLSPGEIFFTDTSWKM